MKEDIHIFQGLKRGNHQIRQKAEFLWDAHNIRLTNRDDSTLLSITNEKGTKDTGITFKEFYVGHCVLGKYLVVFTATEDDGYSYIYRVERVGNSFKTVVLYEGYLYLDPNKPIEAIGNYETELVQKVYWVDGVNQPRVINIAKPELRIPTRYIIDGTNFTGPNGGNPSNRYHEDDPDVNQYLYTNLPAGLYVEGEFDFVRELKLEESVYVTKTIGTGMFSPGTIQYAFTYYSKYGQETNIFYTTPLYYISHEGRGGSPEDKVSNSFKINVDNIDTRFDYLRIYSIHRTSIDAVPTVKRVEDVSLTGNLRQLDTSVYGISFLDTGTSGDTIDPTQLLYIGGRPLVANCIAHMDGTLFLGGLSLRSLDVKQVKEICADYELDDHDIELAPITTNSVSTYYDYNSSLNGKYSATFKFNEVYRIGYQVQFSNGEWSEPIFFGDVTINGVPIWESYPVSISKAIRILDSNPLLPLKKSLRGIGVRKIRACVVFPSFLDRNVICQGVVCPTVYNVANRRANAPYAMSSWFFRPAFNEVAMDNEDSGNIYHGASIQFKHNYSLYSGGNRGAEVQSMLTGADTLSAITNYEDYTSHFLVDENIITMHSPDIEFDSNIANYDFLNTKLVIFGAAYLGAISGDIDITTSTPTISPDTPGFVHETIGFQTRNNEFINGGLISGLFYNDSKIKKGGGYEIHSGGSWLVYPWHRSGSLNNDENRPDDKGERTAVLAKKKISNLKFFNTNKSIGDYFTFDISTPQLFSSDEVSLLKIHPNHLNKDVTYLGNVDTLVASNNDYHLYWGSSFTDSLHETTSTGEIIYKSRDPVRIKYKSSPHLVMSLQGGLKDIPLLPRHRTIGNTQNGAFTYPDWDDIGSSDGSNDDREIYDGDIIKATSRDLDSGYPSPSNEEVGKYAISYLGRAGYQTLCTPVYQQHAGKLKWTSVSKEVFEGKIMRVLPGTFIYIGSGGSPLPGTSTSDYVNSVYRGSTKYYRVHFPGTSKEITLIDVTETSSRSGSPESRSEGSVSYNLSQSSFGDKDDRNMGLPYLLIGEIVRESVPSRFGGTSDDAIRQNLWLPASDPIIIDDSDGDIVIPFDYGDTWYQRYDCLKTYPFTNEDTNSVVEIGSFMCETRVNIDGRYDRNRGQYSNINMNPTNFNLINEVYSQRDDFFNYRILDEDYYKQDKFLSQVTWSKGKSSGEYIDTWSNISLASTLDMDGSKGVVTAIRPYNQVLVCFQEKAVSQILFNSRVQIPVSDGVPIEISNGYKVDGSKFISDSVGCQDKWSIAGGNTGIYFIDCNTDSIWLYNGQLTNLSDTLGMKWWTQNNRTDKLWKPIEYRGQVVTNGIRTFYDSTNGDVYFVPGVIYSTEKDALCYSEVLGQFTSQMSYGGTQAMFQFGGSFFSLRGNKDYGYTVPGVKLYENFKGNYNSFFGETKGWDFSFVSNENPLYTKIFDTVELRADHWWTQGTTQLLNSSPISFINAENEYQRATSDVNSRNMRKKFRVWRGLIPRNNNTRQRVRNPWTLIKLGWKPMNGLQPGEYSKKAIVHDVSVKYTV